MTTAVTSTEQSKTHTTLFEWAKNRTQANQIYPNRFTDRSRREAIQQTGCLWATYIVAWTATDSASLSLCSLLSHYLSLANPFRYRSDSGELLCARRLPKDYTIPVLCFNIWAQQLTSVNLNGCRHTVSSDSEARSTEHFLMNYYCQAPQELTNLVCSRNSLTSDDSSPASLFNFTKG